MSKKLDIYGDFHAVEKAMLKDTKWKAMYAQSLMLRKASEKADKMERTHEDRMIKYENEFWSKRGF